MKASRRLRHSGLIIAVFVLLSYLPAAAGAPSATPAAPMHAAQSGAVIVNEFVASNQNGLTDEDGDHSDWLELYNPGAATIDLTGWSLTDDATNPDKWVLPARLLPPGAYLVVFASNKNRTPPSGELHTNFALSAAGEYLGLYDNASPRQVVDEYAPEFPEQYQDVSYGRYGASEYRYFASPTPGAANTTTPYYGVVADVTHSLPRGYFYDDEFTVTLQTTTPSAAIRHSRTGYAPSPTNGTIYSGPVYVYDSMPVRAIAYRSGYLPSSVATQTYLLPNKIKLQPPDPFGYPLTWGSWNGLPVNADYEMDPAVVNDPRYSSTIASDLRTLPALTISADRVDLFNEVSGIYANPTQSGDEWERPVSVELINPDGSTAFQIDAGLRIHGNSTRQPDVTPKHSMRLYFRSDYGADELDYPLFADSNVESFDVLVLDALYDDSWLLSERGVYARDQWIKNTLTTMGRVGVHNFYVHLYLDGLYWGIYNITERVDDHFAAAYFGGGEADYDVIYLAGEGYVRADAGDTVAWNAMMDIAEAGVGSQAQYQAIQEYLDVDSLIDFMLIHIYAGNPIPWQFVDWKAVRRRAEGEPFQFMVWDNGSEMEYVSLNDTDAGATAPNTPFYLYHRLRDNPEFRLRFADRVHQHFFNGGVFYVDPARPAWDPAHPERNLPASRFDALVQQIDRAVVAESARWGDVSTPGTVFKRDDHWIYKRDQMFNQFFPQRSAIVLQQLRDANLYPAVAAPEFNQHGGNVPAGFQLSMTAPSGAIYFTTDGSDPRVPVSGAVSPGATAYSGPVSLPAGVTEVKARALSGGAWSALTAATFNAPQDLAGLRITEIMYHPLVSEDYEFIELKNTGATTLDLTGVAFTAGIAFSFPAGFTLPPGEFAVLAVNLTAFAQRYPGVAVAGAFTGALSNGGEQLVLSGPGPTTLIDMTYDDAPPWPTSPDGLGNSLVIIDPLGDPNLASNWRASSFIHGSPGEDDPAPFYGGVIINELLAHSDLPLEDAIELHNPTAQAINIGGWFLSDSAATLKKYRIADGTTIQPGGYAVFYEYQFNDPANPPNIPFAFSSQGEEAYLAAADAGGTLTGYVSSVSFGASANGVSLGRFTTSVGDDFTAMSRRTFGEDNPATVQQFRTGTGLPNAYPLVGPVVINELMYNPLTGDEFLELQNITDNEVPLYDPANPANGWALTNGVDFTFPSSAAVPARGRALVVPVDPETFRLTYSIPLTVPIYGPYTGALNNGGETVELSRPDEPDGLVIPYIAVDAVAYDDAAPWPTEPDGTGPSLARLSPATYGNDPLNWQASVPGGTPGRRNAGCLFADVQPNATHTTPAACDGDVDVADVQTVAACWNKPIGTAACPATLNVDGLNPSVTVGDLIAVAMRWNWPN